MKRVVLTFDDGRKDNYSNAFSIMKKYGLKGTLFITTGCIDGSYVNENWASADKAMEVCELKEMRNYGFEIASHGDRHTTDSDDFMVSLDKIRGWGLAEKDEKIGFSIPNSDVEKSKIEELQERFQKQISYIRKGRECNTKSLYIRVLYVLYGMFGLKGAYYLFNKKNIVKGFDGNLIPSVVIKRRDNAEMVLNFIEKIPDESVCVFMLHSILDKNDSKYESDEWTWSAQNFEKLCSGLKENPNVIVSAMKDVREANNG